MKRLILIGCILAMLAVVGCAGVTPNTVIGTPLMGFFYSDLKYPHPRTEVVNNGIGSKTGKAMAKDILGLVAVGDASIEAAMRDGKINKVYTVDHHVLNILSVYVEYTTIVTGE